MTNFRTIQATYKGISTIIGNGSDPYFSYEYKNEVT